MNARLGESGQSDQTATPASLSGFLSGDHRALLARLLEVLTLRRGLTAVCGPEGVGKSSLIHQLQGQLPPNYVCCTPVSAPQVGEDLYAALLPTPNATPSSGVDDGALATMREALGLWLRQRALRDAWTVLILDDADTLPPSVLAEVDYLAGLEPMLQIVLVARSSQFLTAGSDSGVAGLAARVRERAEICAMKPDDWAEFVARATTGEMQILPFEADAVGALGSFARGLPGPMLALAAKSSDAARQQWAKQVTKEFVQMVAGGVDPAVELMAPAFSTPSASPHRAPRLDNDPFRDSPARLTIRSPELLPVLSDPHSIQAEWFRVLQLRIEDWVRESGGGPKAILVTGANSNAGKSLVAVNLALLWAHNSWQRVLLIDGDMRRPQHDALFEIPRRPGFADVLAGRATVDEASAFISETGLHVLPAGRPGNPRQLANPDHVARVFEAARESFDVVIVDSPPLSAMVDSRSMAASADGVLMVVRAGSTRLQALRKTLEFMPGDNLIGAVVNGGEKDEHSAYAEYQRSVPRG